jgi:hypothetical protein
MDTFTKSLVRFTMDDGSFETLWLLTDPDQTRIMTKGEFDSLFTELEWAYDQLDQTRTNLIIKANAKGAL